MPCPTCGATIEFDRRFSPWCTACDWNLITADERPPATSAIDRRRLAIGRRLAARPLAPTGADRPTPWSVPSIVLWLSAVAVFVAWALLVIVGIRLIVDGFGIVAVLIGLFLLGVAFVGRPRLGDAPEDVLDRDAAPTLHAVVDRVASDLGAPTIHVIEIDGDWNAATYRFGLRRRTALRIGLPLWHALDAEQRVALLGHELGHGVNGDTSRAAIQSAALQTLFEWAVITEPDGLTSDDGLAGLASIPANLVLLTVSRSLLALLQGLLLLHLGPSRQAELYADRLAARVGGVVAARTMLERLALESAYRRSVSGVAVRGARPETFFDELERQLEATPATEIERLRRRELVDPMSGDSTHPPLAIRLVSLEALDASPPRLVVDAAEMQAIDAELATVEVKVAKSVIEDYLDAIS